MKKIKPKQSERRNEKEKKLSQWKDGGTNAESEKDILQSNKKIQQWRDEKKHRNNNKDKKLLAQEIKYQIGQYSFALDIQLVYVDKIKPGKKKHLNFFHSLCSFAWFEYKTSTQRHFSTCIDLYAQSVFDLPDDVGVNGYRKW